MKHPVLIIAGSARSSGATMDCIQTVFADAHCTIIDLSTLPIATYNYDAVYPEKDHFLSIIESMINSRVIVFATPVYWYAMSGLMKVFFDRFTDIVTVQKHLGRSLKDKSIFLLSVGADAELPDGFEVPFASTAKYLCMNYEGSLYHSTKYPKNGAESNDEKERFMAAIIKANA